MGGDTGKALAQVGVGFLAERGRMNAESAIQQRQKEDQFAIQGAQQLAAAGSLDNLAPDIKKSIEKRIGKDGFAALQQQNQLNQTMNLIKRGAEASIGQVQETQQVQQFPQGGAQGPPVLEEQTTTRQATPQEAFSRFNEFGPLGVFALTGDVQAGQLAQQQARLAQDQAEFAAAPIRQRNKQLNELEASLTEKGVNFFRTTREQAGQIRQLAQTPEGQQALQQKGIDPNRIRINVVDDQAFIVQTDRKLSQDITDRLAAIGKTPSTATPQQIGAAIDAANRQSLNAAGAGAVAKADMLREMKGKTPIHEASPEVAAQIFDVTTGQNVDLTTTFDQIFKENPKGFKRLNNKQIQALQSTQTARETFQDVIKTTQRLFGQGGILNKGTGLLGRGKATAAAIQNLLTQNNVDLAAFRAQLGQLAQVLNRENFGGVGTQTEQDRAFAMKALAELGDLTTLADRPEVAAKKINDIAKRFIKIEQALLGKQRNPESLFVDVKQAHNAFDPQPQVQAAPQQGANDVSNLAEIGFSPEEIAQVQQGIQSGQIKPEAIAAFIESKKKVQNPVR